MSRSYRDSRGKRINGEIWGYGEFKVSETGKVLPAITGSPAGSALRKRDAKKEVSSLRRLKDKELIKEGLVSENCI